MSMRWSRHADRRGGVLVRHGSVNRGPWAPETVARIAPESPCCARCRRGIRGFGELPCGYDGDCKCHKKERGGEVSL